MILYPYASYNFSILQGKAYKTIQNCITKCLVKYNLSLSEWKVLGQLYDNKNLRVADLSVILGYDASLITNLIDSLESKGLIQRIASKTDLRVKQIMLTEKARLHIPEIESEIWKIVLLLLEKITQKELKAYLKTLQAIIKAGSEFTQESPH